VGEVLAEVVMDPAPVAAYFVTMLKQKLHPSAGNGVVLEVQTMPIMELIYIGTGSDVGRKSCLIEDASRLESRQRLERRSSVDMPVHHDAADTVRHGSEVRQTQHMYCEI